MAWDLAWDRAERRESMRVRLRRCSSSPVRVRKKRSPRFSRVHMALPREIGSEGEAEVSSWVVC